MRPKLYIMLKAPAMGRSKTRLAHDIGSVQTNRIHRGMISKVVRNVQDPRWDTVLSVARQTGSGNLNTLVDNIPQISQVSGTLSARLAQLFANKGPTVVIGTDCPQIKSDDIAQAFKAINKRTAVFGPASDGGFWLMGAMAPLSSSIFESVRWSHSETLSDIGDKFENKKLLRTLRDVDDLLSLQEYKKQVKRDNQWFSKVDQDFEFLNEAIGVSKTNSITEERGFNPLVLKPDIGENEIKVDFEIPKQDPEGIIFNINSDGVIDLAKPADIPSLIADQQTLSADENLLWDRIQKISEGLSNRLNGSNALPKLAAKMLNYNEVINFEPRNIANIYVEGILIRKQLLRDLSVLRSDISLVTVNETFEDLLALHSTLIGTSVVGKKLLAGASLHEQLTANKEAKNVEQTSFFKMNLLGSEFITLEAAEALTEIEAMARTESEPNKSKLVSLISLENFTKVLALHLKASGAIIGAAVLQKSGVGAEAINAGTALVDFTTVWLTATLPQMQSLMGPIGADVHWIQAFQNWLNWKQNNS